MLKKIISFVLSFTLIASQPVFAQGVAQINLGNYLRTVGSSVAMDKFRPLHMRYFSYDALSDNFQLLLDKGDNKDIKEAELEEKTKVLMDYFKIGLSLPNEKFWVNLRPDAQDQIIDPELEKTDMGKIMLEADLQLKKDTAGLTSPQNPEGKLYWEKLYKKAGELFGSENITIPTITRPWIVPGEIILRQGEDSAYIFKANMKVMLEQDHLKGSQVYDFKDLRMKELNEYSSQLIRELIIPRLTKEVNTSKRYASLRQVFFSLVMARWFKDTFGSSGSARAPENSYIKLIDSGDLTNLTSKESWSKTYYFNEYKKSFEKGEYNLKEDIYTSTGQVIRSYVSGGIVSSSIVNNGFEGLKKSLLPIVLSFVSLFSGFSGNSKGELTSVAAAEVIKDKASENLANLVRSSESLLNSLEAKAVSAEEKEKIKKIKDDFAMVVKSGLENEAFYRAMNKILTQANMLMQWKTIDAVHQEMVKQLNENLTVIMNMPTKFFERQAEVINKIRANPFKPNDLYHEMYKAYDGLSQDTLRAEELAKILKKVLDEGMKRSADGRIEFPVHSDNEINEILKWFGGIPLNEFLPKGQTSEKVFRRAANVLLPRETFVKYFSKSSSSSIGHKLPDKLPKEKAKMLLEEAFAEEGDIGQPTLNDITLFSGRANSLEGGYANDSEAAEEFATKIKFDMMDIARKAANKLKVYNNNVVAGKFFSTVKKLRYEKGKMPTVGDVISKVNDKGVSSAVGGIDFRQMNYLVQPMGNFKDLRFGLPTLSSSALERIDLDKELESLRGLVKAGMLPSGMRVKEYLAACFQKGKIEEKQDDLLVCLAEIYRLAEEENLETSPELRESLVIVDTGKFALLPNNQRAGLN